ncbi:winged helix-turn-helix transcriptional regulator [Streptomyces sp. NRRL F-5630]|uniref:winged helix-turn-helix transcriptional regulator n=1 Tax=Streptomyces sp. NRRL F-5630 TaxID=1463864 RepID=UPI003D70EF2F
MPRQTQTRQTQTRQSPPRPSQPRRRSYDQYCAVSRALDSVGDRWSLLVVRELLAGPRRYTDLLADLPGVSTDMLATRLRDMERDGLATRRRLPAPSSASVYELTARGRELLPVLTALAAWGAPDLTSRRPTDAVRAHWLALPLLTQLAAALPAPAVIEVELPEGLFHLRPHTPDTHPPYAEGPAEAPDARLHMSADTCRALGEGTLTLPEAVKEGLVRVTGASGTARGLAAPAA